MSFLLIHESLYIECTNSEYKIRVFGKTVLDQFDIILKCKTNNSQSPFRMTGVSEHNSHSIFCGFFFNLILEKNPQKIE